MIFQNFSDDARIWVYQSNRELTPDEQLYLGKQLSIFVDQWSAHGKKLTASAAVVDAFRIAICAEGNVEASGCSIDASVRFIKEMGEELKVDFFNRLQILSETNGAKQMIPFSQLKEDLDRFIYNPSLTTMRDFRTRSYIQVKEYLAL